VATFRGITLSKTFSPKCSRASRATWVQRLLRTSNIVSSSPSSSSRGFIASRTRSIVCINDASPSSAKYSHCKGISTESAATRALSVRRPSDGGESIRITR